MNRIHKLTIVMSLMLLISCATITTHVINLRSSATNKVLFSIEVPKSVEDFSTCSVVNLFPLGDVDVITHAMAIFECENGNRYGVIVTNDELEDVVGLIKYDGTSGKMTSYKVVNGKAVEVSQEALLNYLRPPTKI